MRIRPFAIESFPVEARLVVTPAPDDDDGVNVSLDMGGGEGPVIAQAEWVESPTMVGGGFLCWSMHGDIFTEDPRWIPSDALVAIRHMAQKTYGAMMKERGRA